MIPIQIRDNERAAIQLLKPALESALYESKIDLDIPEEYTGVRGFYEDNLKINKLAYAAIEEYNLPLIRTWYKYGQYEPYDEIDPKALDIGDNSKDAYIPSSLKTDVTQGRIKDYLLDRDLPSMFEKELFEFLIDNYEEWDPEPYTNTYIASTKIIRVLEDLQQPEENVILDAGDLRRVFKQASIDLRYDLESIETFDDELYEHAQNYLLDLEDALRVIDETSELNEEQMETISEARKVYHQYVWPWAALQISLDKAKGPTESREDFDSGGRAMLKEDKGTYETYLTGWETRLQEQNLRPGFAKRQKEYSPPDAVRKLQRAALENN